MRRGLVGRDRAADLDEEKLLTFEEFFVNFQLSSLFNWAWTFDEIRLDDAYLLFERFSDQSSRLGSLIEDFERTAEPEPEEDRSAGMPRLLVHRLALNEGSAHFSDGVPDPTVKIDAGPVTIAIQELSTLPDRSGQQTVSVVLANGARLNWQGTLNLAPLDSEGQLMVENAGLEQLAAYLGAYAPIETLQATLSARTAYRVQEQQDGTLSFELSDLQGTLDGLAVTGLEPAVEFLRIEAIEWRGGSLRYPGQTVHLESIHVRSPGVNTWLDQQGALNLAALVPATEEPEAPAPAGSSDWQFELDKLTVSDGDIAFEDRSLQPASALRLVGLEMALEKLSNADGAAMPLTLETGLDGGGRLGFEGLLTVLPAPLLDGTAEVSNIPLSLAQPYVEQQLAVKIDQGALNARIDLTVHPEQQLTAAGEATVSDLRVLDTRREESLLSWNSLDIDRIEADAIARTLGMSILSFDQPYGRIKINEDRSTNLSQLLIVAENSTVAEADGAESGNGTDWAAVIGGIKIEDGSMDFSDLSLPLPFGTRISGLEGTVSTIDSNSTEPANIRLEGQVDEYGLARIEGSMNVLDPVQKTDVTVEFVNLMMSNLSPYTVEFAGREIDEGKLNLNLQYVVDEGKLAGQNDVVLSDLVLGAEVESPNATSLPLGLAVALLKDSNGVIDVDLPVEGDINDPEFKIGGVIWKAFAGLIVKVVSAPFRLLGSLVGLDSEDFGQFQFLAGRSDLTPPELEKIGLLEEALQKRPELVMEINGAWASNADVPALKFIRLRDTVLQRLGGEKEDLDVEVEMLDESLRGILEDLFAERFPDVELDAVKALHTLPPPDDPEGKAVLDQLAYAGDLRDRLLDAEDITPEDLAALAQARAQAVYDAFMANGVLDAARVKLGKAAEVESEDGEWIPMELGVAAE